MNSGSEALEEGLQVILEPYLWEAVSGEEANVNWEEALYSSLMGFVSANITEGVDMAIDATAKVTNPTDTVRTQKAVTDGQNALMSPIDNLDITAPEQLQSALTDQIKKAEPKMTSENMGQQSETVTAESNQTNVTVNPEAVAQSLMNKGFNPETSAEIADAVAARLNGQELTKAQRNILSSAINSPSVQSVISDMQKVQKGSQKLLAGNSGKSTGTVQPINNQADVAQSQRNKGINSKKADGIAEAITASLNGQELTRPQRNILRSALESPTVQSVASEFMKKKADGIDNAQNNVYDRDKIIGDLEHGSAFQDTLPDTQRREAVSEAVGFANNHNVTVIEGSALHQLQNEFSDGSYEGGASASRPTWRQSELDAAADFPDYDAQKSFINGEEVPYGTKGSVRPDYYKAGFSVDIKNYNVENASGRSNLVRNIEKQHSQRTGNLPDGTKQAVMIDVRGQNVSISALIALYNDIIQKTHNGVEILFKMK